MFQLILLNGPPDSQPRIVVSYHFDPFGKAPGKLREKSFLMMIGNSGELKATHRKLIQHALAGQGQLIMPGVYDVLSAKIAARAGFEVIFIS